MRYYFDCEFIEDGRTIELISIAIAAEDGRSLYCVSNEYDPSKANDWVKVNVLPKIGQDKELWISRKEIAKRILDFIGSDRHPIFWGYYADYDWVSLCQLYGSMAALPSGWPMYCRDIKQLADMMGSPRLPLQGDGGHNALFDAMWNKRAHEFLMELMSIEESSNRWR